MDNETGWIKFHRKILDNPIVFKDSEHFSIWCLLLLLATHKEYKATFKGKEIILQPRTINHWQKMDC